MTVPFEPTPDDSGGFRAPDKPGRWFSRQVKGDSARRAPKSSALAPKGTNLPSMSPRARPGRSCSRRANRRRAQRRDQPQDIREQAARDGNLSHLEGNVAAVADDLCANLDQLLPQAGERPILDRLRRCERAKEVPKI